MEGSTSSCARICACALGVALGVLSAVVVVVIGLLAHFVHYGNAWVNMAASVYVGFAATPQGIVIGALWAFGEGFVFGYLLGVLYNAICKRCPCKICRPAA